MIDSANVIYYKTEKKIEKVCLDNKGRFHIWLNLLFYVQLGMMTQKLYSVSLKIKIAINFNGIINRDCVSRWGGDGPPIEILVSPEWCVIMAHLIRWGWRATRT